MHDKRIQQAIDHGLSGLALSQTRVYEIRALAKGGQKVKKKLSLSLVLAIALIALALTAVAVMTLQQYYEKTIEKEGKNGLIQYWQPEDKLTLVDWMIAAGARPDPLKQDKLSDKSISLAEKGEIAWEIIQEEYPARDGVLTAVDIIAKEKGPMEGWSLEDKAWYSEMMQKYQPGEIAARHLLPKEGELTKEEAIARMYAYYEQTYGLKKQDFDEEKMSVSYVENTWDDGHGPERLIAWQMDLWLREDPVPMGITILPDGSIKQATGPYVSDFQDEWYQCLMADDFWTIEGMYRFQQEWTPRVAQLLEKGEKLPKALEYLISKDYGLPEEGDLPLEEAREKAKEAVLALPNWTQEKLALFGIREAYRVDDPARHEYRFVFSYRMGHFPEKQIQKAEKMRQQGLIPYHVIVRLDAKDGNLIQAQEDLSNHIGFGM